MSAPCMAYTGPTSCVSAGHCIARASGDTWEIPRIWVHAPFVHVGFPVQQMEPGSTMRNVSAGHRRTSHLPLWQYRALRSACEGQQVTWPGLS
eukprot:3282075-Rhodomonas_salina.2